MVRFFLSDETLLFAAAIWDAWTNKVTGELIESFAIVTSTPDSFISPTGHDRMPAFLESNAFEQWLNPLPLPIAQLTSLLLNSQPRLALKVEIDRPLRAGWEKRA
jgi:putative SOS response-associated peptidase YedK